MRNAGLNFVCRDVTLTVDNSQSAFTSGYRQGELIRVPVAHHDGNYFADSDTLDRLEGEGRSAFRYAEGVNGSHRGIARVAHEAGNVLGMLAPPANTGGAAGRGAGGRNVEITGVGATY